MNGRRFHLSHTLPDYDPGKPIHDVSFLEFLYGEPDYTKVYGEDTLFVTGHTPTMLIDPEYARRIWQKNNHIAIRSGAFALIPCEKFILNRRLRLTSSLLDCNI